ncbi:MAG TPA: hypothetical protein VF498_02400 [Anaerolineales bacterium]
MFDIPGILILTARRRDGAQSNPAEWSIDVKDAMPCPTVRAVTNDAELRDIYAYLHSLPPVASATR